MFYTFTHIQNTLPHKRKEITFSLPNMCHAIDILISKCWLPYIQKL
jgi:hypothetical protein